MRSSRSAAFRRSDRNSTFSYVSNSVRRGREKVRVWGREGVRVGEGGGEGVGEGEG